MDIRNISRATRLSVNLTIARDILGEMLSDAGNYDDLVDPQLTAYAEFIDKSIRGYEGLNLLLQIVDEFQQAFRDGITPPSGDLQDDTGESAEAEDDKSVRPQDDHPSEVDDEPTT